MVGNHFYMYSFTREPESHACKGVDEWLSVQGSAPWRNPERKDATAVRPWSFTLFTGLFRYGRYKHKEGQRERRDLGAGRGLFRKPL